MRLLATLSLFLVLLTTQAQRPSIASLLSLTDCLDTTCVSEHVRPMGYCLKAGKEEDGWAWYTCGPLDSLVNYELMVHLGFFGYARSNYRDYTIFTGDTTAADTLTAELRRLGFTVESPLGREGHIYGNSAYPALEIQRLEKHHTSIEFRMKGDPPDPRSGAMDTLECGHEEILKMAKEKGHDHIDRIPHLLWVFRVRVPTPHLIVRPGGMDGTFILLYPASDPVREFVIRDLSEKEVLRSMTQGLKTEIDLSDQPNGAYFLTIRTAAGMISTTFMKD